MLSSHPARTAARCALAVATTMDFRHSLEVTLLLVPVNSALFGKRAACLALPKRSYGANPVGRLQAGYEGRDSVTPRIRRRSPYRKNLRLYLPGRFAAHETSTREWSAEASLHCSSTQR